MMAVKLKRREQGHAKMLDTHSTTSEQTNNTGQTERERVRTGERPASGGGGNQSRQAGRRAGEQRVNVDGAANWRCTTERHTTAGSDRAGQRRTANPPRPGCKSWPRPLTYGRRKRSPSLCPSLAGRALADHTQKAASLGKSQLPHVAWRRLPFSPPPPKERSNEKRGRCQMLYLFLDCASPVATGTDDKRFHRQSQ